MRAKTFFNPGKCGPTASFGLLILRIGVGLSIALTHGWPKVESFKAKALLFPDPLGLGKAVSLALVSGAELVCGLAIVVGLATRWAAVPLVIAMLVAIFLVHGGDAWASKELAVLYLVAFLTLVFTGAGQSSLDAAISGN